jgi:outer membrane protein insertion porin family
VLAVLVREGQEPADEDLQDLPKHPSEALLDPEQVEADLRALYESGGIQDLRADFDDHILVYTLTPAPALVRVRFTGALPKSTRSLRRLLGLSFQRRVERANIETSVASLREALEREGFYQLSFSHQLRPLSKASDESPGTVELVVHFQPSERLRVSSLVLDGAEQLDPETLRQGLKAAPRGLGRFRTKPPLSRAALADDALALLGKYLDAGYLDASVSEPEISLDTARQSARVRFLISEGEPYHVASVSFAGDWEQTPEDLAALVSAKPGEVFRRTALAEEAAALSLSYRNRGYADATVSLRPEKDGAAHQVKLSYVLQRGPAYRIGRIDLRGHKHTAESVFRRELLLSEGEPYHEGKLSESKRRILNLGFVERADISSQRSSTPGLLDLEVNVKDVGLSFFPSAGFGSGPVLGALQWYAFNLFGRGHTLSASLLLSPGAQLGLESSLSARYTAPHVAATEGFLSVEGKHYERALPGLLFGESSALAQWSQPLNKHLWVAAAYSLRYQGGGLFGVDAAPLPDELLRLGRRGSLDAVIEYDKSDASKGKRFFVALDGGTASAFLGSQAAFAQGGARLRWSRPLRKKKPKGLALHTAASLRGVASLDGEEVPYADRLFVGGIGSVRGFETFGLSPQVEGLRVGGTRSATISGEIDWPLLQSTLFLPLSQIRRPVGLSLCGFLDAGNAFAPGSSLVLDEEARDFGFSPLRVAGGLGLKYLGPWLGVPVRLDFAQPLDPRPGERLQVHFYLGSPF